MEAQYAELNEAEPPKAAICQAIWRQKAGIYVSAILVAGGFAMLAAQLCDTKPAYHPNEMYTYTFAPDPEVDYVACGLPRPGLLCDPDHLIASSSRMASILEALDVVKNTRSKDGNRYTLMVVVMKQFSVGWFESEQEALNQIGDDYADRWSGLKEHAGYAALLMVSLEPFHVRIDHLGYGEISWLLPTDTCTELAQQMINDVHDSTAHPGKLVELGVRSLSSTMLAGQQESLWKELAVNIRKILDWAFLFCVCAACIGACVSPSQRGTSRSDSGGSSCGGGGCGGCGGGV